MSLLDIAMREFAKMQKIEKPDGVGGHITEYVPEFTFKGAVVLSGVQEIEPGESMKNKSIYTLTTGRDINLKYHDVIVRADGKSFRITSDNDDSMTPSTTSLDMRQCKCEEFRI